MPETTAPGPDDRPTVAEDLIAGLSQLAESLESGNLDNCKVTRRNAYPVNEATVKSLVAEVAQLEKRLAEAEEERDDLVSDGCEHAESLGTVYRKLWEAEKELAAARAAGPVPKDVLRAAKDYDDADSWCPSTRRAAAKMCDWILSLSPPESGRG